MADPNIEMLRAAVAQLGELTRELVFVGGCTTGLFITDEAAAEVRPTDDVDTIVHATTYAQYIRFEEKLQTAGFTRDTSEGAPICRWLGDIIVLDVIPLNEKILGFSNTWHRPAAESAQFKEIAPNITIKVVTPPYFCATKLETFQDRGNNDFLSSHDLEDLVNVIDGRPTLVDELSDSPADLRSYVASEIGRLLKSREFLDALPGYLLPDRASQARIPILLERLQKIAALE